MIFLSEQAIDSQNVQTSIFSGLNKLLKTIRLNFYSLIFFPVLMTNLQATEKREIGEENLPVVKVHQTKLTLESLSERITLLEDESRHLKEDNRHLKQKLEETTKQLGYLSTNPPTYKKYIPADNLFLGCMACGLAYGICTFDLINGLYYAVIGLTVIVSLRNVAVIRGTPQPRAKN